MGFGPCEVSLATADFKMTKRDLTPDSLSPRVVGRGERRSPSLPASLIRAGEAASPGFRRRSASYAEQAGVAGKPVGVFPTSPLSPWDSVA